MHLRTVTSHDFSLYKKSTIERRMSQHQMESTGIYPRYLKENPAEVHRLFKEFLINVTSFFRDAEAFSALQQDILPRLCKDKADDDPFRVWVAGCTAGEEAYSIAISLRELMDQALQEFTLKIYSTDLDVDAISSQEPVKTAKETNFAEHTRRILVQSFAPPSAVTDLKGHHRLP